jgi:hypothetical protein
VSRETWGTALRLIGGATEGVAGGLRVANPLAGMIVGGVGAALGLVGDMLGSWGEPVVRITRLRDLARAQRQVDEDVDAAIGDRPSTPPESDR